MLTLTTTSPKRGPRIALMMAKTMHAAAAAATTVPQRTLQTAPHFAT